MGLRITRYFRLAIFASEPPNAIQHAAETRRDLWRGQLPRQRIHSGDCRAGIGKPIWWLGIALPARAAERLGRRGARVRSHRGASPHSCRIRGALFQTPTARVASALLWSR